MTEPRSTTCKIAIPQLTCDGKWTEIVIEHVFMFTSPKQSLNTKPSLREVESSELSLSTKLIIVVLVIFVDRKWKTLYTRCLNIRKIKYIDYLVGKNASTFPPCSFESLRQGGGTKTHNCYIPSEVSPPVVLIYFFRFTLLDYY